MPPSGVPSHWILAPKLVAGEGGRPGSWSAGANWTPVGAPAIGDDVFVGNLPGVQNTTVSLGAAIDARPDHLTITDGMTLRTNTSRLWAGSRIRVDGSNLVGGGGGIATLFRSTLRLD